MGKTGRKALGQDLCPLKGAKSKRGIGRVDAAPGSEQIEAQTEHPSPGVLCGGDKPPCLVGELLAQVKRLAQPRHRSRVHRCLPGPRARWGEVFPNYLHVFPSLHGASVTTQISGKID